MLSVVCRSCLGFAANDFQSSCADLFRVSTSLFARSKAWMPTDRSPSAEGPRHKAGQRRNWGCDVPPFIAARSSPDSPAASGEREGPANREGEGQQATDLGRFGTQNAEPDSRGLVPGIHGSWRRACRGPWLAMSSPAKTRGCGLCLALSIREGRVPFARQVGQEHDPRLVGVPFNKPISVCRSGR